MTLDELQSLGTDAEYLAWIRTQPSCITGQFSEWTDKGWRNPACHVRRVKYGSGMATKGQYNAVPMTHEEHAIQTNHGEAACLNAYFAGDWTPAMAKSWFENQVERHRRMWAESRDT